MLLLTTVVRLVSPFFLCFFRFATVGCFYLVLLSHNGSLVEFIFIYLFIYVIIIKIRSKFICIFLFYFKCGSFV